MKLEQKLERLEVRLRANVDGESEMIAALAELDGKYGEKNELMRRCLLQGYLMLKQKMQSVSGSGNGVEAIDALAQAILGSEYDYRVIKTYLHARQAMAETEQAGVVALVQPTDNVAHRELVQSKPEPTTQAQAALEAVADAIAVKAVLHPAEDGELRSARVVETDAKPVIHDEPTDAAPARKHNWSHMRTVAGSTGGAAKSDTASPDPDTGGSSQEKSE